MAASGQGPESCYVATLFSIRRAGRALLHRLELSTVTLASIYGFCLMRLQGAALCSARYSFLTSRNIRRRPLPPARPRVLGLDTYCLGILTR